MPCPKYYRYRKMVYVPGHYRWQDGFRTYVAPHYKWVKVSKKKYNRELKKAVREAERKIAKAELYRRKHRKRKSGRRLRKI